MKKYWQAHVVGVLLLTLMAGSAAGQGKGGGKQPSEPTEVQVTSHLAEGYLLRSDGLGAYSSFKAGKDTVESVVYTGSGDWLLNTTNSTSRGKQLTLSGGTLPWNAALGAEVSVKGRLLACGQPFGTEPQTNLLTMPPYGQMECMLRLTFTGPDNKNYALVMNPANGKGPETVTVTCTAVNGSNQCAAWQVTTDRDLEPEGTPRRALLEEILKSGSTAAKGEFDLSVLATISLQ
jgi:hypothetical protein